MPVCSRIPRAEAMPATMASTQPNSRLNRGGFRVLVLAIAVLTLAPIVVAVLALFADTGDTWSHLARYVLPEAFVNTLLLVVGVVFCTTIIGVSLAWLVAVCEFPGRRWFEWALQGRLVRRGRLARAWRSALLPLRFRDRERGPVLANAA